MNIAQNVLPELEMERDLASEAARIVLHTILFCRSLGPLSPEEVDSTMFPNVTYLRSGDAENSQLVDTTVENFINHLQVVGPDLHRGELVLSFYEERCKSSFLGMKSNREKVIWEQWRIPMIISTVAPATAEDSDAHILDRNRRQETQQNALIQQIKSIVDMNNQRGTDHLPPFRINSETALTYKFEITCTSANSRDQQSESWFKKIIQTEPPILT